MIITIQKFANTCDDCGRRTEPGKNFIKRSSRKPYLDKKNKK